MNYAIEARIREIIPQSKVPVAAIDNRSPGDDPRRVDSAGVIP
jgi:hypothetical protein